MAHQPLVPPTQQAQLLVRNRSRFSREPSAYSIRLSSKPSLVREKPLF